LKALAILAERVVRAPDGLLSIVRVIDTVATTKMPAVYPELALYCELHCEPSDSGEEIRIGFRIIGPEGNQIVPEQLEPAEIVPAVSGGRTKLVKEKPMANIPFATFGPHLFQVFVNGECVAESPLMVAKHG
jgi:hypothetical protein